MSVSVRLGGGKGAYIVVIEGRLYEGTCTSANLFKDFIAAMRPRWLPDRACQSCNAEKSVAALVHLK